MAMAIVTRIVVYGGRAAVVCTGPVLGGVC